MELWPKILVVFSNIANCDKGILKAKCYYEPHASLFGIGCYEYFIASVIMLDRTSEHGLECGV
jgi:hypothetical protein